MNINSGPAARSSQLSTLCLSSQFVFVFSPLLLLLDYSELNGSSSSSSSARK